MSSGCRSKRHIKPSDWSGTWAANEQHIRLGLHRRDRIVKQRFGGVVLDVDGGRRPESSAQRRRRRAAASVALTKKARFPCGGLILGEEPVGQQVSFRLKTSKGGCLVFRELSFAPRKKLLSRGRPTLPEFARALQNDVAGLDLRVAAFRFACGPFSFRSCHLAKMPPLASCFNLSFEMMLVFVA